MHLTTKEQAAINLIALSAKSFCDNFTDPIWSEGCAYNEAWGEKAKAQRAIVPETSFPGTVAALQAKGLVCCTGKGKDATVYITETGKECVTVL